MPGGDALCAPEGSREVQKASGQRATKKDKQSLRAFRGVVFSCCCPSGANGKERSPEGNILPGGQLIDFILPKGARRLSAPLAKLYLSVAP